MNVGALFLALFNRTKHLRTSNALGRELRVHDDGVFTFDLWRNRSSVENSCWSFHQPPLLGLDLGHTVGFCRHINMDVSG
jgi:hypothetical protein